MLRLNQYIIFLVVWLGFFFNVERLHIHKVELVDIAGPIYALAIIVVLIGLILPQYRLISHRSLELFVIVLFGLAKLLDPNPFWGDRYTYVTLFEVGAILVTAFLAHEVGRQTADFMRTVRMILFADQQERVLTPEQAAPILQREMKAARRTNKPLTVLVVEAKPGDHQMHLNATANEIHQLLVKRYRLVALTRLLTQFIRSTDFVLDWSERGRIIFVTPEVNRAQVNVVASRLNDRAHQTMGVTFNWGAATFPEQGLTLEELIYQAEQNLGTADRSDIDQEALPLASATPQDSLGVTHSYTTGGE